MPLKKTLALFVVFLVLALFVWKLNRPANVAPADRKLLAFDPADVRALVYSAPGAKPIEVRRHDGVWVLPAKADFPVDFPRFRAFVQTLVELESGAPVHGGEKLLDELGFGDTQATTIRLLGEGDKSLALLRLGKERLQGENAFPDGRYMRAGDDGPVVLLAETPAGLPFGALPWIDVQLIGLGPDALESVEIRHAGGEIHTPDVASFWALSYLRFQDVRQPAEDFAAQQDITLKAKDGYTVHLQLAAKDEAGLAALRYRVEGGDGNERANQLRAREGWEYLIRESDAAPLREMPKTQPAAEEPDAESASENAPTK